MTLIAVQEWQMPEKTIREAMDEMCHCGHHRFSHSDTGTGACAACVRAGVGRLWCLRFRLDPE